MCINLSIFLELFLFDETVWSLVLSLVWHKVTQIKAILFKIDFPKFLSENLMKIATLNITHAKTNAYIIIMLTPIDSTHIWCYLCQTTLIYTLYWMSYDSFKNLFLYYHNSLHDHSYISKSIWLNINYNIVCYPHERITHQLPWMVNKIMWLDYFLYILETDKLYRLFV